MGAGWGIKLKNKKQLRFLEPESILWNTSAKKWMSYNVTNVFLFFFRFFHLFLFYFCYSIALLPHLLGCVFFVPFFTVYNFFLQLFFFFLLYSREKMTDWLTDCSNDLLFCLGEKKGVWKEGNWETVNCIFVGVVVVKIAKINMNLLVKYLFYSWKYYTL